MFYLEMMNIRMMKKDLNYLKFLINLFKKLINKVY
jgi:hypothetical protein